MARREQTTTQHPAVEAAHTDLASLEGQKNTVQAEILDSAENKKRLETDYEDRKREIEDDLAIRRREGDIEREKLENQNIPLKAENNRLEQSNSELKKEVATLGTTASSLTEQIGRKEIEREKLISSVGELVNTKIALQKEVNEITPEADALQSKVSLLTKDATELEAKKQTLTHEVTALETKHDSVSKSHIVVTTARNEAQKELTDLEKKISAAKELLATTQNDFIEVERKSGEIVVEAAGKLKEANERLGNAHKLELHVDEKLSHLKELESHFTTEHLARFGYKKTN